MNKNQLGNRLTDLLAREIDAKDWDITSSEDKITIQHRAQKNTGFHLSIPAILAKIGKNNEEQVIEETVKKVVYMVQGSLKEKKLAGRTEQIFPVIRSSSNFIEKNGLHYLNENHTAETKIYYALDLGNTYTLIHQQMLNESGYSQEEISRFAITNLKKLDNTFKEDQLSGNKFYFFSQRDGYAASRVLNVELMAFMKRKIEKEMAVAIPHQDVLIVADIQNENGYKILAKLNMDFCIKGDMPISPLPFLQNEDGELEPILIISNPGASPKIIRK